MLDVAVIREGGSPVDCSTNRLIRYNPNNVNRLRKEMEYEFPSTIRRYIPVLSSGFESMFESDIDLNEIFGD